MAATNRNPDTAGSVDQNPPPPLRDRDVDRAPGRCRRTTRHPNLVSSHGFAFIRDASTVRVARVALPPANVITTGVQGPTRLSRECPAQWTAEGRQST